MEEIIILFLMPIIDMFRVCVNRVFRGTHPFKKDKRHLHYILENYTDNSLIRQGCTILTVINLILFKIINKPFTVICLGVFFYFSAVMFFKYNKKN